MAVTLPETMSTEEKTQILSDDQIEQLLQEAENRLRQKAGLEVGKLSEVQAHQHVKIPTLQHGLNKSTYIREHNGIARADPNLLVTKQQEKMANELRSVERDPASKRVNDVTTSGPNWFDMPKTDLTPQLKRDLQLIEMRNVLDPHRHYKKNTRRAKVPTFSQTGTVIEGPTEFYSGRINKKERSKNFVEEAMKTERESGRFKRKYNDIQGAKTSGKKGHYKKLMAQRNKAT